MPPSPVPTSGTLLKELEAETVSPLAPRVAFRRGKILARQGEVCDHLFVIIQGRVMLSRHSADGESYALHLLGPGDLMGESAFNSEGRWTVTVSPVSDGVARAIPKANVRRILQLRPDLIEPIVGLLCGRIERAYRRFDILTTSTARERVLGFLTLMGDYHGELSGSEVWLPLTLSQTQIGEMVGLARETVARIMVSLEEEGLIRRANRQGLWLRVTEQPFPPTSTERHPTLPGSPR